MARPVLTTEEIKHSMVCMFVLIQGGINLRKSFDFVRYAILPKLSLTCNINGIVTSQRGHFNSSKDGRALSSNHVCMLRNFSMKQPAEADITGFPPTLFGREL